MFLAPINYNRFFERIFKKIPIVKRFLEDLLGVEITEIEPFPRKTKLTIDAAYIEFDYRCKINGQYVILDMQQWYKNDVVKRFYMYDCNNTSLQLEMLAPVTVKTFDGKEYKTRDYNQIEPTTTIIWMVDDTLGYKENMISFALTPDLLTDFMRNEAIWGANDWQTLLRLRAEMLKILDNDTKGISFLAKNKLIFVFQKNIIKNAIMADYVRWFTFAEATKNVNNTEQDFLIYKDDPIFSMMMNELAVNNFDMNDFNYAMDYEDFVLNNQEYFDMVKRNLAMEMKIEIRQEVRQEVRQEEQLRLIRKCLKRGDSHQDIAAFLEIEPIQLAHYIALLSNDQ